MTATSDTSLELLIVGAGPVGLLAAVCAARAGIAAKVVDHTHRGFGRGYATLLHPATVRLLDELGLLEAVSRHGRLIHGVGVRVPGAPRVRVALPTPALAVAQGALEEALLAALRQTHVEIVSPWEATTIAQDAGGVHVRLVRKELVTLGSPGDYSDWVPVESRMVHAKFVLGADGYESRVRTALGIEVAKLGETQSFAMFEVPSHEDASPDIELGFTDGLGAVVMPLAGVRARLGFQLNSGLDQEPDAARLHELLSTRAPWFADGMKRVDWSSVIHFERRLVRRFGSGRVWLAGDAAHVTTPFGAQSMNLGLSEAADIVRRVAACIQKGDPLEVLSEYGAERQREWHKLLGFHVKFDLLGHAPPWLGALASQISSTLPASGSDLKELLRQLGLKVS
jgi:2-polyprenyl-6-methoxyphenol hydroxylase-like FAD-dependent oxidoreductase